MICSANSANATVAGACEKFHKPLANRPALGAYLVGKSGMSTTTQEFEAPDTIARAARAADSYHAETDDLVGERMVLNMGPSHPATHGVLRLILELNGEIIHSADPDVGFLHRGDEKIAENMHYNQFVPYTDRLDYACCAASLPASHPTCWESASARWTWVP
jgi:hypothetical protein